MTISPIGAGEPITNLFARNGPDILAKQTYYLNRRELTNLSSVDKYTHSVVKTVKQGSL